MTGSTHSLALAAVAFRGADAAQFLQGQLTVNTQTLAAGQWRRAAYCSRQGRMLANGLLLQVAAEEPYFLFVMAADNAEPIAAMLQRFVLRAKVKISVPPLAIFAALPSDSALPPVLEAGEVRQEAEGIVLDEGGGLRLLLSESESPPAPDNARVLTAAEWQENEIRRGVAWVSEKTQDMFIPQFVNYELLGGVDFVKGCFVGQEVIARLHHLGAVKRRGMIIRGSGTASAGDGLKSADDKPVGEVVNSVATESGFIAYAAVMKTAVEKEVFTESAAIPVAIEPPPYPIVEQEKFNRR